MVQSNVCFWPKAVINNAVGGIIQLPADRHASAGFLLNEFHWMVARRSLVRSQSLTARVSGGSYQWLVPSFDSSRCSFYRRR